MISCAWAQLAACLQEILTCGASAVHKKDAARSESIPSAHVVANPCNPVPQLYLQQYFFLHPYGLFTTERRPCSTLAVQESATTHFRHPLRGNMTETEKNVMQRVHDMSNLGDLTKNRIQDNNIGKNVDHASPCRKIHDEMPKTRKKPIIEILESLGIVQPNQVVFIRNMSRDKEYRSDPRYLRSECISP